MLFVLFNRSLSILCSVFLFPQCKSVLPTETLFAFKGVRAIEEETTEHPERGKELY